MMLNFINRIEFLSIMMNSGIARLLCRVAEAQRPPWQLVKDRVRSIRHRNEMFNSGDLHGMVSEAYVKGQFMMATQLIPDTVEWIEIPHGLQTQNYLFLQNNGATSVYELEHTEQGPRKGIPVTDLDGLLAVGRNYDPFLIEVKLEEYGLNTDGWFGNEVTRIINRPDSLKGVKPVMEYFQLLYELGFLEEAPKDIGIILVIPPESYTSNAGSRQRNFEREGGIIMQFPCSAQEYAQKVYGLAEVFNSKGS